MKKAVVFLIFMFLGCQANVFSYIAFEQSMKADLSRRHDYHRDAQWKLFKTLYESYQKDFRLADKYIIPKLIHFIWLGSPLPERCKMMVYSWSKFHPEWTIKVWTDDDVDSFNLENLTAFENAKNYGEKSDIWRYEILYRYGGLYVDTDFECLKPFDDLHRSCEFYVGVSYDDDPILYNGLIGTKANHPIMKSCVENIRISIGDNSALRILTETGPYYLSKIFLSLASESAYGTIVPFPLTFFYPFPNARRHITNQDQIKKLFVKEESMAIHYWAVSWQ